MAAAWGAETVVWALLTWGIWLLTLTAVDTEDLFVGGLTSLGCGLAAAAARRVYAGDWRPKPADFLPALVVPAAIVTDTVAVLLSPWRHATPPVDIVKVDIGAAGPTSSAKARRAIAVFVVTVTPATVVLDSDPDSGRLTVHRLRARGPDVLERYEAK